MKRQVVSIDYSKCTGCNLCIEGCHQNALSISDGKIVVRESYCDGLGMCLLSCSVGALEIIKKEVRAFEGKA